MSSTTVYVASRQESESERDCLRQERLLTTGSQDVTCFVTNFEILTLPK